MICRMGRFFCLVAAPFYLLSVSSVAMAATPSINGANIPTLPSLVDSKSNTWTLVSGVAYANGKPAAYSAGVTKLIYLNGTIYQENASLKFWSWSGTGWVGPITDPRAVSKRNTTIPSAEYIIDGQLNVWTLVNGQVYENGKLPAYSANAVSVIFNNGTIYHENGSQNFYAWNGTSWVPSPLNGIVSPLDWASVQARNTSCLPFGVQSPANYEKSPHKVFAHYMLNFPMKDDGNPFASPSEYFTNGFINPLGENGSPHLRYGGYLRSRPLPVAASDAITNYEQEIRVALSIGIDGFTPDIMGTGALTQLEAMLTAIQNVNAQTGSHFVIMPVIDAYAMRADVNFAADVLTILDTLRTNPNVMRLPDGRLAFSSFDPENFTASVWAGIISKLQATEGGKMPAFVPIFASMGAYSTANGSSGAFDKISYMISTWGDRTPNGEASYETAPAEFHAKKLGFMMPVAPQDFRPKDAIYTEAGNSAAYRNGWTSAVKGGADWVQLVTWNDYSEHSHVAPSFGTQYGFYDLAAYYISLFKGYPTYIGKDSVYLFYRNQLSGTGAPVPNAVAQSTSIRLIQSDAGPSDRVEAVVFTDSNDFKPGYNPVLNLTVGGVTTQFKIPSAGMTVFSVPMTFPSSGGNAAVSANIMVNGTSSVSFAAPMPIKKSILVQNFLYQSASATQGGTVACGFPGQAGYQTIQDALYQSVASRLASP